MLPALWNLGEVVAQQEGEGRRGGCSLGGSVGVRGGKNFTVVSELEGFEEARERQLVSATPA